MCLIGGTKVLTSNGYKDIQLLTVSDVLQSNENNTIHIDQTHNETYTGNISSILPVSTNIPLRATPDHPFLTKTMISTGFGEKDFILSEKTSWTPAGSLKSRKHLLCIPIEEKQEPAPIYIQVGNQKRESIDIDWFMVGFYFGKGKRTLDVQFIPPGWSVLKEFTLNHRTATCNHIPEWIQRLPIQDINEFIRGFKTSTKRIGGGYEVVNEEVALNLQRLYAKIHRFVRIHISDISVCLIEINDNRVSFDRQYMYIPIDRVSDKKKTTSTYHINIEHKACVIDNIVSKY